jgi:hypothetical protein
MIWRFLSMVRACGLFVCAIAADTEAESATAVNLAWMEIKTFCS